MKGFEFGTVVRIVFGRGQAARIGELAAALGQTALVVANGSAETLAGVVERLKAAGIRTVGFRQKGEPSVDDVDRAVALARQEGCDLVVGLGGGSAIDAAKAVAGLISNGGSALDYMEVVGQGRKITRPAVPWIAVPTTAGTGAEATRNAVIGYPVKHFKASIRSEHLLARIALVDPELGMGLPAEVTARSGMDALCQLIEAYTSSGAQPMSDALALRGLRHGARSLKTLYLNGADLDAREDLTLAALLSGIALAHAGLGAVHGFAAPLGAVYPIPHGTICAALLPHIMAANIAALRGVDLRHPVLDRYAAIGRILAGDEDLPHDTAISEGVEQARGLCRDLHIPGLHRFGLGEADLPALVAMAQKSSSMRYNPVVLPEGTLRDVLQRAL